MTSALREREGSWSKRDNSTDRLHEWDSDKGGRGPKIQKFCGRHLIIAPNACTLCNSLDSLNCLSHSHTKKIFSAQETIHKQAVLCHRVLRRIQDVVQQSRIMDRVTWEALLVFLLAINDALLAPPAVKGTLRNRRTEVWLI